MSFFQTGSRDPLVHILSFLKLEDLLTASEACKKLRTFSFDGRIWAYLFKEYSGVSIESDAYAFKKFLLYYLFKKGLQYSNINSPKHINRTKKYFAEVALLFIQLEDNIKEEDLPWLLYVKGEMFCNGYYYQANIRKGFNYLLHAAALNNSQAMVSLAAIYSNDFDDLSSQKRWNGFKTNYAAGRMWLKKATETNNIDALMILAKHHARGYLPFQIQLDQTKLIESLQRAANHGSCAAAEALGHRYLSSTQESKVLKPEKESHFWFKKAVTLRSVSAALQLTDLYFDREKYFGVKANESDIENGLFYLQQAFKLKSSEAAFQLARIYAGNNIINLNEPYRYQGFRRRKAARVIHWLEQGARFKTDYSEKCAMALASIYASKEFGQVPNLAKVLYWYDQGSALGSASYLELGKLYLTGHKELGLVCNMEKAEETFAKAFFYADQDQPNSNVAYEIANFYKQNAEKNKVYLSQCVKWHMRGVRLQYDKSVEKLHELFRGAELSKRFSQMLPEKENSFSISNLTRHVASDYISADAAMKLAQHCYKTLNLPVIDDPFLQIYQSQNEKLEKHRLQQFALETQALIRFGM